MIQKIKNLNTLQKFFLQMFVILAVVVAVLAYGIKIYYENDLQKNIEKIISDGEKQVHAKIQQLDDQNDINKVREIVKEYLDKQHFDALIIRGKNNRIIINEQPKIDSEFIKRIFNRELIFEYKEPISKLIPDIHSDNVYLLYITKVPDAFIKVLIKLDDKQVQMMENEAAEYIGTIILTSLVIIFFAFIIVYRQFKELINKENQLLYANVSILNVLGNAVSKRDSDTDEHNYRVTYYSVKIAELLKLEKQAIRDLIKGAFLHDVGKIGIEDRILLKPGKLTDEEFELMKKHVELGEDIVSGIDWLENSIKVIAYHHEKYNGKGYPNGLKGEDIPIEARIFAVVDVFDALTSKRPYKDPFSVEKSLDIIEDGAGNHFDPNIVEIFTKHIEKFHKEVHNKTKGELETILEKILRPYFLDK